MKVYRKISIGIILIPLFIVCSFFIIKAVSWLLAHFISSDILNLIILAVWIIVFLFFLYGIIDWLLDRVILEEKKIRSIKWNGILNIEEDVIEYTNIQKIEVKANFIQKLLNIGDVQIYDAGVGIVDIKDLFLIDSFIENINAKR